MKKVLVLALALLLTFSFVACGSGSKDKDASSGKDGGDSQTLNVWCWDPSFNIYAIEEAAKIYEKDNPGFKVDVTEMAWDDLQTALVTAASSGQTEELPDIFLCQNNAFQKNVTNYPDLFVDISDSEVDFDQFAEAAVGYSLVDGKNYGVPFDNGTAVVALRTDILAEAGYTLEDFTDITWDQFIDQGKVVLEKTGKPLLSGIAGESDTIAIMLQSEGSSLFNDDGSVNIANNEELKSAIEVYQRLVKEGVLLEVNSWDEYIATFVSGSVAGAMQGCWILANVQSADDQSGLWDVTNVPKVAGVSGATNYSAQGGSSWAISSNSANSDLATDFLAKTFGGSVELYDNILPKTGALSNWLPAADSDVYNEPQEYFGGDAVYAKIVEYAGKVPSVNTGVYYYEGRDAVSDAITKSLGGADIKTALKEAEDTVKFDMGQ
ncbi:MAG: extracellular solute-binding protein [Clostridiales Family XIII bacterium]|nr:extracellular solute-binding protein [Clostridiales Family XIII bacterium]